MLRRCLHRRTGQHPFGGGQTEFCPNAFSGGGGVVAEISGIQIQGGGVVAEIFRDPYYVFQLTAVADPKFGFFSRYLQ